MGTDKKSKAASTSSFGTSAGYDMRRVKKEDVKELNITIGHLYSSKDANHWYKGEIEGWAPNGYGVMHDTKGIFSTGYFKDAVKNGFIEKRSYNHDLGMHLWEEDKLQSKKGISKDDPEYQTAVEEVAKAQAKMEEVEAIDEDTLVDQKIGVITNFSF
eukprot:m.111285 g.111285  ORF g.111285 m.111285 type:complete len:158 (-) comp14056_c0_seq2:1882-2355(-)